MASYIKIQELLLSRLNNAEYTNFMQRASTLIAECGGTEKLGIDGALFSAFSQNILKMTDIVSQAATAFETKQMIEADVARDNILAYYFSTVKASRWLPVEASRNAALRLFDLNKAYRGLRKLPNQQETQRVEGLLFDLDKPEYVKHISTLGLTNIIGELKTVNTLYRTLTDNRIKSKLDNTLEASRAVRLEMNGQYDDITSQVFALSVINPSDETAEFIKSLNAVISETRTLLRKRIAQRRRTVGEGQATDAMPEDGSETATDAAAESAGADA